MDHNAARPDVGQIRAELRRIVSEVIGVELTEGDDDTYLLDIVTSSLALVEGMRRVFESFGVLVSFRHIIEGEATLRALAVYIDQALTSQKSQTAATATESADVSDRRRQIPLRPSQVHVGFLTRYSQGAAAAFNEALLLRLRGSLDGPALQAALETVVERYDALRTSLSPDVDALDIEIGREVPLELVPCAADEVERKLGEIVSRPFEAGKPLFRARLLRLSSEDHLLALVGHRLVLDQVGLSVALEEIASFYRAAALGESGAAPPLALQWTECLTRQSAAQTETTRRKAEAYWRDLFSRNIPRLALPTDHPRPAVKRYEGARLVVPLEPDLASRLHRWAEQAGTSPESVLFAVYSALLHRLSGQKEIIVGFGNEPGDPNSREKVVARSQKMTPVHSRFDPRQTFSEHIREHLEAIRVAREHGHLSLAELIQILNVRRDQSRSPLFLAAFRIQEIGTPPEFGPLLRPGFVTAPSSGARYDIEFILSSSGSDLALVCDYSTELFAPETVARWLDGLLTYLDCGLRDSAQPCGLLPVMTPAERQQLLVEWNATDQPYLTEKTVLDLITDQINLRSKQPALRAGGETLTYEGLGARLDRIAGLLQTKGASPGERIGVLLPRSLELIPALLAVWRVGAIYVPLDPSFPRKRIVYMLADAGVRLVVTVSELLSLFDGLAGVESICLDTYAGGPAASSRESMRPARSADSAYIMYTSGSTGRPKGVEIGHRGLINLMQATRKILGFSTGDTFLALTTASFDISGLEFYLPLIAGGMIDLAEEGLGGDGFGLAKRIARQRPAYVQATPSTWKTLLAADWAGDPELCIISAGEALSRDLAEALLTHARAVWNLYGPTETTVFSAACQVTSDPDGPVRIGRPLPNTQLYVLDDYLQPLPLGAVGELYIGGDGLAHGYWHRPHLTAARFVPNPFEPGKRLYRTGDLARHLPDGEIQCLGRIDHQVKVHGVRVEVGEVEIALKRIPEVRDAVVTSWTDGRGDIQLVGHLLVEQEKRPTVSSVRARLRELLPEVMIPPHLLFSDAFPLTENGKAHRASLPTPDSTNRETRTEVAAPATPTEELLAEAWAEVLGIEVSAIGRDHNFMNLGGHSLLMTPLMLEIRKQFSVSFNMREFFGAPTIRTFAALIDKRRRARSGRGNGQGQTRPVQYTDWGKQRMAFLRREAELPPSIAPARGMFYQPRSETRKALLTGATGFLGVYLAAEILETTDVHLYCLVRPKRGEDSRQRIENQMRRYAVWQETEAWAAAWRERLHVVEGDVTLPRLGIVDATYETLAREIDAIIHSAAHVNFIYPYESLRASNVLGVHEIIRFAFHTHIKPVHYLSTAAIWPMGAKQTFYERDSIEHGRQLNLGYDESKWVAEMCLLNAAERGLPVARYRPGEVGGDSVTGRCVIDHFLIAAVKGFIQFGLFPALDKQVDVAPVDYVAKALVYLAFRRNTLGRAFHLTNPRCAHMSEGLTFLRELGYRFSEMRFEELRDRLIEHGDFTQNALFPYQAMLHEMRDVNLELPTYDTTETRRELEGSGIVCPPADEELFGTYISYLQSVGFMPEPNSQPARQLSHTH